MLSLNDFERSPGPERWHLLLSSCFLIGISYVVCVQMSPISFVARGKGCVQQRK